MEPLIFERTQENLTMAISLYLREENEKHPNPNLEKHIDIVRANVTKFEEPFLRSVYDRC